MLTPCLKIRFLFSFLIAFVALLCTTVHPALGSVTPITVSTFDGPPGANPSAGVILSSEGALYGTANGGGINDVGTLFKITTNDGFDLLRTFSGTNEANVNADGANPESPLIEGNDGNFYGTVSSGGLNSSGTVFETSPTGAFKTLYSFNFAAFYQCHN